MSDAASDIPISLIRGGSFYWIQEKARLIRPHTWDLQRRLPSALAVTWLPLLVLAMVHGGWLDLRALLTDYRVNARLLVAVPLLLIGQITMETRFREMAQHFLDANIIRLEELPRFREIMQTTSRLRDAKLPEIIALILVYAHVGYFLTSGRLHFAAWAVDSLGAPEAAAAAALAKAYCARAARDVCEAVIQVHGGIGNTWDCLAHVFLRRALLSIELFGGAEHNVSRVLAHHGVAVAAGGGHGLR